MYHLQVNEADQFRLLAEENRVNIRLIVPTRGVIYDRKGRVIADNTQNYGLTIVKEEAGDVERVIARLRTLVRLEDRQVARALRELVRRPGFVPVLLGDGFSWHDLSAVAVNAPALPGIAPEVRQIRAYPFGADFAHTVGYTGRVSPGDLAADQDDDPLLQMPQFEIGKFGVEQKLDRQLRGKAGSRRVEVNAAGRIMRVLGQDNRTPGATVQLTLDAALQNFAAQRLGRASGAAVVIDIPGGDVRAAVSAPSFDPNLFVRGISQTTFDRLLDDDRRPLHDKITQGVYPPGSTVKMMTVLAALHTGAVSADETIRCRGYVELGERRFYCWKHTGHGLVDARKSLSESCDVYYYTICQRIGIEKIAAMARRFGLGSRYGLPMTSVAAGLVPDKAWKMRNREQAWLIGDTLNAAIGQGFMLASPMQLGVMIARLACGLQITPRIIRAIDERQTPLGRGISLGLDPAHLGVVIDGLHAAVNTAQGTAHDSRILTRGHEWVGKTGTSQVRTITPRERERGVRLNEELPRAQRDHALFVGFAPAKAPRHAIAVVVEHGGSGGRVAAPIARDIMLYALNEGLPPLGAYPAVQRDTVEALLESLSLRDFSHTHDTRGQA